MECFLVDLRTSKEMLTWIVSRAEKVNVILQQNVSFGLPYVLGSRKTVLFWVQFSAQSIEPVWIVRLIAIGLICKIARPNVRPKAQTAHNALNNGQKVVGCNRLQVRGIL